MIYGNYFYVVTVDASHWIFAIQYYTTAKSLQYHLEHRNCSTIRKREKILYCGMAVALIILTVLTVLLSNDTNSKEIYVLDLIMKSLVTFFITVVVIVSLWVVHKVTKENEGLISNLIIRRFIFWWLHLCFIPVQISLLLLLQIILILNFWLLVLFGFCAYLFQKVYLH